MLLFPTLRPSRPLYPLPSLVLRFVKDQFDDYRESTIGGSFSLPPLEAPPNLVTDRTAAFLTQTVNLEDGTTVKFEIWYAWLTHSQGYVHDLIVT
jgi:hypothetical protein